MIDIPNEIWAEILSYLDGYQRAQISVTNKLFYYCFRNLYSNLHISQPEKYRNVAYFKEYSFYNLFKYGHEDIAIQYIKKKPVSLVLAYRMSAKYGFLKAMKEIERRYHINCIDADLLNVICKRGHDKVLYHLMQKGYNLTEKQVCLACKSGNIDLVQRLFKEYKVYGKDHLLVRSLFYSARSGNLQLYKIVLSHINFNLLSSYETSHLLRVSFYRAIFSGNLELIDFIRSKLQDYKPNLNWDLIVQGASYSGLTDLIKEAIHNGASLVDGFYYAIKASNIKSYKLLLSYDPNSSYYEVAIALYRGNPEILKLLTPTSSQIFFIHVRDRDEKTLRWAIDNGARDFRAGFLKACHLGDIELIEYMISQMNMDEDFISRKIIMIACRYNYLNLLKYGIEKYGITDLHTAIRKAIRYRSSECYQLLNSHFKS